MLTTTIRHLEKFADYALLTTNKFGVLDEVTRSMIHVKRYLGNLSSSDRDWIVQKHLEDLKTGKASPGKSFDEDEDVLPDLTLFGSMDKRGG